MRDELIISVDAMGGDTAPETVIDGIEHYLKMYDVLPNIRFILHGNQSRLMPLLQNTPLTSTRSDIHHTDLAIEMDAKPSHALRRGKGSSLWNTIEAVKNKTAKVGVSAGNTGALMAMSKLQLRMQKGVQRPAIAALWPHVKGTCVVLDVGANIECDAAQLTEFAVLGDAYYRALFKTDQPKIGLLNVGTEELKGNAIIKAAHERLSQSALGLNYVGYVEGTDISLGDVDVIVTDGFTGNIALKTAEGTAGLIAEFFKESFQETLWSRLTSFLNLSSINRLKKRMDPRRVNGGVFLGLNGIMIKSHGGSDAIGYANALSIAAKLSQTSFLDEIERTLTALHDEDNTIGFGT